jgi:hypothetical protein
MKQKMKPKGDGPSKAHGPALKGLRDAGAKRNAPPVRVPSAPPYKQPPPVDPSKILRDAIKAKQIEALAEEAVS